MKFFMGNGNLCELNYFVKLCRAFALIQLGFFIAALVCRGLSRRFPHARRVYAQAYDPE